MRINWRVRIRSKAFWMGISGVTLGFIFNILGQLDVQSPVTQGLLSDFISTLLAILGALGVLVDPTTQGISDSRKALFYNKPYRD